MGDVFCRPAWREFKAATSTTPFWIAVVAGVILTLLVQRLLG